ncbi:MAG: Gfo/Idh/MocA family oxidoreductase [Pirellulaceae bacterium]|nr:Gfo/Idh/MocA family oxidoreductase [Pirellulaceae bacterium]
MNLTPEEREVGRDNYYEAVGVRRREFLKGVLASSAVSAGGLGAAYYGYQKVGDPVRVGIIGTGDEGGILIGALNPDYMQVTAIADIRPSSIHRALHGDWGGSNPNVTHSLRPGLIQKYGWNGEDEARKNVQVFDADNGGWQELLQAADVEAVIIALPLHLHAEVAIAAMEAGKHVVTEKLMAHSVGQCKAMCQKAQGTDRLLATGHQRHYSILYDNAVQLLRWGILGEVQFIRAQWHRGNLPGRDSWEQPIPGGQVTPRGSTYDPIARQLASFQKKLERSKDSTARSLLEKQIAQWTRWDTDKNVPAEAHGYENIKLSNGQDRSALEELVRWRLWDRTGGGLMAELGSHQLDAASIFISALRRDGQKARPLTVHAVGGRHTFPLNRDADDHVYCTFEFPGPGYDPAENPQERFGYYDKVADFPSKETGIPSYQDDPNKKIIVTYSSIMGNGFGGYGETIMGTKATLILDREKEAMLYKGSSTSTKVAVKDDGGGPSLDTQASGDMAPVAKAADAKPVSRGYTEELEHFAWCVRNKAPENQPRCHPEIALADAVIALTSKLAIKRANSGQGGYVQFKDSWFEIDDPATPEDDLKV